jgi:hypothetical protein
MAARVTKLFLQPHREAAGPSTTYLDAPGKAKAAKLVTLGKKPVVGESAVKKTLKRSKKSAGKKTQERFLDAARRELAQSDRTRENVRKLRVKTPAKTQKLMAKVRLEPALPRRRVARLLTSLSLLLHVRRRSRSGNRFCGEDTHGDCSASWLGSALARRGHSSLQINRFNVWLSFGHVVRCLLLLVDSESKETTKARRLRMGAWMQGGVRC